MRSILVVFGTRPEAIKMAPLVKELRDSSEMIVKVCVTGQHREMLDQVLDLFQIDTDFDLNLMRPGQDLYSITCDVLQGLKLVYREVQPDLVLVHGDTTTSMAAALAAYYEGIKVGHIEAGLRTKNLLSPFPEEGNRQITARITHFHFAPTEKSRMNLLNEGVNANDIFVTGNTVIDAVKWVTQRLKEDTNLKIQAQGLLVEKGYTLYRNGQKKRVVLITGHRRENIGEGFINIFHGIRKLCDRFKDVDFVYPMHLNPKVRNAVITVFGTQGTNSNLFLLEPLQYLEFIYLLSESYLVLTDSGGIQEEAPGLGVPVLVLRDTTERPEAVEAGTVRLVGTNAEKLITEASAILTDKDVWLEMSRAINPYGDGKTSKRIVDLLSNYLR